MEKKTILSSFFWTALETYSTELIAFAISVVMARILSPGDYGILGIIAVFLAVSNTLIDSGFSSALINKKECTKEDFSTVFYFNIAISIVLFMILYFSAPLIAEFYNNSLLLWTSRAMGLTFIISSLAGVQLTIVTKELKFKVKAWISIIVATLSGIIGIYLAYTGWGVWALVWQSVASAAIKSACYILYVRWIPLLVFSKQSFKELFGFGSKLLGSNIIYTLFNNIYNLVIGKAFNATQLGYFTRADAYAKLVPNNISGILGKILFPILSKEKDNEAELALLHTKFIIVTSYFIFPGCLFLAGFASPLIYLMISEKWMPIVPLLQILCFAGIFEHFSTINSNFMLARGNSTYYMKIQVVTKPIGIIILALSIIGNMQIVALGRILYSMTCFFTGYHYLKKVLAVRFSNSIGEIVKLFIISLLIGLGANLIFEIVEYTWINLIAWGIAAVVVYLVFTLLFCKRATKMVCQALKKA